MVCIDSANISLRAAMQVIEGAERAAAGGGLALSVVVVDSGGHLVALKRMDGAVLISATVAQHKARSAALTASPTRVFQDLVDGGATAMLNVEGLCAVAGGIPLITGDKVVGAVGCSGGSADEDEAIAVAGAHILATLA